MNPARVVAGVFALLAVGLGFMMAVRQEPETGRTLILAGAIVIAALVISTAIVDAKNK
ncbi:MAG TPA: hypothetical protein VIG25_05075 [Pyrinomonadaceae bacterium]